MRSLPACFSGMMACILRGMIVARFAFTRHNIAYHTGGALCRQFGRTTGLRFGHRITSVRFCGEFLSHT